MLLLNILPALIIVHYAVELNKRYTRERFRVTWQIKYIVPSPDTVRRKIGNLRQNFSPTEFYITLTWNSANYYLTLRC